MRQEFVDTSYWLALLHEQDSLHSRAKSIPVTGRMITTLAVVLEVMDAFSTPRHRKLAQTFWQITRTDPIIEVVELSKSLMEEAAELFQNRPDKAWSMTDCISFVVMQERGITDALTADHHFEQAGFRALLRA